MNHFSFLFSSFLAFFLPVTIHAGLSTHDCVINNVCYVIDQSGSIKPPLHKKEQDFVFEIAKLIEEISPVTPSNSAVAFSTTARTIRKSTTSIKEFKAAVRAERIFQGNTFISTGIYQCTNELENVVENKLIILLTDGETDCTDVQESFDAAAEAKSNGINIITIGIGNEVSIDFLIAIASDPSFFIDTTFDKLESKVPLVAKTICSAAECSDACENAFKICEFTFAGRKGLQTFDISGEPDLSFTTRIVPKDVTYALGSLNTNNIIPDFIDENGTATEIVEFGSQRFTPTHFKPFWIAQDRGSGIGHQTFHGNQEQKATDRCVRVYFTHFQEFRETGLVNRNNVARSENKCVVFRTI